MARTDHSRSVSDIPSLTSLTLPLASIRQSSSSFNTHAQNTTSLQRQVRHLSETWATSASNTSRRALKRAAVRAQPEVRAFVDTAREYSQQLLYLDFHILHLNNPSSRGGDGIDGPRDPLATAHPDYKTLIASLQRASAVLASASARLTHFVALVDKTLTIADRISCRWSDDSGHARWHGAEVRARQYYRQHVVDVLVEGQEALDEQMKLLRDVLAGCQGEHGGKGAKGGGGKLGEGDKKKMTSGLSETPNTRFWIIKQRFHEVKYRVRYQWIKLYLRYRDRDSNDNDDNSHNHEQQRVAWEGLLQEIEDHACPSSFVIIMLKHKIRTKIIVIEQMKRAQEGASVGRGERPR
ncbi:hypothetical protein F5Y15DRAFT_384192 [Xylariaceae sp. FL0016]|nr:hypothetical protein F5Y15DRAFT_384192 [Xylariaceae sp. FL0016]